MQKIYLDPAFRYVVFKWRLNVCGRCIGVARIFLKGGSHCVKVRVLVSLDIFMLKRHGIFATCSRLFG